MPKQTGHLYVSELFGPTFQGEGPMTGRRAAFIRLAGCNLHCSWCDTKYSWNFGAPAQTDGLLGVGTDLRAPLGENAYGPTYDRHAQVTKMTYEEIMQVIWKMDVDFVVITGGEPMLQQLALVPLIVQLLTAHKWVQIETNGTVLPFKSLAMAHLTSFEQNKVTLLFVISPKLPSAEAGTPEQVKVDYANWLPYSPTFKFVCSTPEDVWDIPSNLPKEHVEVMPQGTTPGDVLTGMRTLAPAVLARGFNITTRLQTLLWGEERGH